MATVPSATFTHTAEEIDAAVTEVDGAIGSEASLAAAIEATASATAATAAQSAVSTAIGALDVESVGGAGKYIKSISETDGVITASAETMDAAPTAESDKAVKSGGVKNYVDTECGAIADAGAKNYCPYNTITATGSGTVVNDQPINLQAGTYILTFKHTATTGSTAFRLSYNGTSVESFTVNNSDTGTKSREFTLSSAANQFRVYTSIANTYTEVMIRRKEVSDATYQPYAPTNRELYEMILALQ